MQKTSAYNVSQKFNELDFHDDGLVSIKICPLHTKTNSTNIDLQFLDDSTGFSKLLSFRGCANLRYIMDFDVLANNWFAQTQRATSIRDVKRMETFVLAQMPHWRVKYMAPSPNNKPIRKKLLSLERYVLFRVIFFGGTLEVLAKDFALKRGNR
jgi:hypothetical protein